MLNTTVPFTSIIKIVDKYNKQQFAPQQVGADADRQDLMSLSLDSYIPGKISERKPGSVKMNNNLVTVNEAGDKLTITTDLSSALKVERTFDKKEQDEPRFINIFTAIAEFVKNPQKQRIC
ncbi:MAG: hypothetical protein AB7V50_07265 [Vampirovibrionia bacterium]